MTWNGLGCSWCGLVVGHVSLCCSVMVVVLLGLLSAKAGSAHRGWEEWWNCERVKESSVHVVSVSVCLKINGGQSTEYPLQLHFSGETLHRSIHFGSVSLYVEWKLLYLDVRPLGLQALRAGQNLLLMAGQSHTHLRQFTTGKTEKTCRHETLFINDTLKEKHLHPSNAKQLVRFHVQGTCLNPLF